LQRQMLDYGGNSSYNNPICGKSGRGTRKFAIHNDQIYIMNPSTYYTKIDVLSLDGKCIRQGRRIDIPCFTKGSRSILGLLTDAEILVTLNGKASAFFEGDVNTYLDRNGLRWLSTVGQGNVSKSINDIVYEFSMTILPEVVKEFGIQNTEKSNLQIDVGNFIYDKDGSTKRKFMRFYYDKAKKLVRKPLIDKINRALGWRNNQNLSHNEILVHDFKIVNTKLIISEESSKSDRMFDRARKEELLHWDTIQASDVANLRKK